MKNIIISFLSVLLFANLAFAQTTVSFQDGTAGYSGTEDTFVHETTATINGSDTNLRADGTYGTPVGEAATLIKWDVSSLPVGATVTAASITLEFHNSSAGVYRVKAQNSNWSEGAAVWADLNPGLTVGTINPGSLGQTTISLNAKGIALVQNWIGNASNNNGIAIVTAGTGDGITAYSREAAAFHPMLEITYTVGGPSNAELLARIETLETLLAGTERQGNTFIFEGMNVKIRNGLGATDGDTGSGPQVNGLGNLIVGYDERPNPPVAVIGGKEGSHNIVVGAGHHYFSYGGFVAGENNEILESYSSVSGGHENMASGDWASVSGGWKNTASGTNSSVSGGESNTASGIRASVSGGVGNTASFTQASVSGGRLNIASGVSSSVSGGEGNEASGLHSSVSGGRDNTSSGTDSTVSGGANRIAAGTDDWVAGSLFETN